MCSFLPYFTSFNRTRGSKLAKPRNPHPFDVNVILKLFSCGMAGGLIQLNHGRPQPLQYVVNAAFLATLFSDYLDAADTPGWYCGPNFYSTDVLRKFAETQVCYN